MAEFFHMGGYALYVWGSFGVSAAFFIAEPLLIRHRREAIITRIRRMARVGRPV